MSSFFSFYDSLFYFFIFIENERNLCMQHAEMLSSSEIYEDRVFGKIDSYWLSEGIFGNFS